MDYYNLVYFHLATVLPAAVLGAFLLAARKGTPRHKLMGKIYMLLMLLTAATTLLMPAHVGPRFLSHFGWIHLFSFIVLWSVPEAWFAIQRGDTKTHMRSMILTYVGAIIIAGGFTLMPGRLLHEWLLG